MLGLRTVIYKVNNLDAAKSWYQLVLGKPPYFDQPFYVGFNVGGFELGLQPAEANVTVGENVVAYWGVNDASSALDMLISKGAEAFEELQDVGEGILVATVKDPFGNVFGIIQNPHFKPD